MLTFIDILFKELKSFDIIEATGVLDFADKVNYLLSPALLLACSVCIGLRELFSKPLACMTPHKTFQMDYQDESMLEGYCWVQGLKIFKRDKAIPVDAKEWQEMTQINYYMWVPLFLAALAILAHLPKLLWDMTNFGGLGVDPTELLRLARGSGHRDRNQRRDEVSIVANVMRRALHGGFWCCSCSCCCCGLKPAECRPSVCLFPAYLLLKVCGMAGVFLQLSILRQFFGLEMTLWSYWNGTALPSVGLCKLTYQEVTSLQSILSYCTISTNVLTEKVVLLLSIYFPIVLSINALSLLLWIYRLTLCRQKFLAKHALLNKCHLGDSKKQKRNQLCKLDKDFLGTNGIFLLHLMQINAGEVFTSELVGDLYRGFFPSEQTNLAADAAECQTDVQYV